MNLASSACISLSFLYIQTNDTFFAVSKRQDVTIFIILLELFSSSDNDSELQNEFEFVVCLLAVFYCLTVTSSGLIINDTKPTRICP